jgi:cytochrome c
MNPQHNKLAGAILVAGVVAMAATVLANHLFPKDYGRDDGERGFALVDPSLIGIAIPAAATATVAVADPILGLLATASVEDGMRAFRKCAACHTPDKGGANRVGPNMWDIVNAKKGHADGFAYSQALLDKGGNWNYASLNLFLYKPKEYIAGTKMNFAGIKDAQERANVIAYLRSLSDSPAALPSEAEIAAEIEALTPQKPKELDAAPEAGESPVSDAE